MHIDVAQAQARHSISIPHQEGSDGFDAFNSFEEADEKALQRSESLLSRISLGMGMTLAETQASDEAFDGLLEAYAGFMSIYRSMPGIGDEEGPASGRSWSKWIGLDTAPYSSTTAGEFFELLLTPDCPPIPQKLLFRLLLDSIEALRDTGPVVEIPTPAKANERQIVVGDTHGQLQDVLHVMLTHGKPSASNRYVFNGDIADRGPCAVEIFALVLLFQLSVPESTWVTRGNHEARDINERPASAGGGFRDEVLAKYDLQTYELFQLYFLHLPVCAVLGSQVLIIHGGARLAVPPFAARRRLAHACVIPTRASAGLSHARAHAHTHAHAHAHAHARAHAHAHANELPAAGLSREHRPTGGAGAPLATDPMGTLRGLNHRRDIPFQPSGPEENVLFDSFWSDPQDEDGIQMGARGDDVIKWGPDVTRAFLAASGLDLIVRSHQVRACACGSRSTRVVRRARALVVSAIELVLPLPAPGAGWTAWHRHASPVEGDHRLLRLQLRRRLRQPRGGTDHPCVGRRRRRGVHGDEPQTAA